MKKIIVALSVVLLFVASFVFAQTAPALFTVHEHIVKPSMNAKFREAAKKLKAACEQYKINFGWTTIAYDDNSYVHVAPLTSFADLGKNPFADLETKMGKEALGKIWAEVGACIESEADYVIASMPQFSYLSPESGDNYRDVTFWYAEPGKEGDAEGVFAEWKKLYESKKSPNGYAVYKLVFGGESRYAIIGWGKNELDLATKNQKSNELLGEEAGKLWTKTLAITKRYYSKRANVVPDMSYSLPK